MDWGTDINSTWSFKDGDLNIISDDDNTNQAIINRLNCYKPTLNVYYEQYGGFLKNYMGMKKTSQLLDFMKIEIDTILQQDPRILNFISKLSFNDDDGVDINLIIQQEENEDIELNLVLNGDVVEDAD